MQSWKKPHFKLVRLFVGPPGLEPGTTWLWVRCSNQLSYRPAHFLMRDANIYKRPDWFSSRNKIDDALKFFLWGKQATGLIIRLFNLSLKILTFILCLKITYAENCFTLNYYFITWKCSGSTRKGSPQDRSQQPSRRSFNDTIFVRSFIGNAR